MRNLAAGGLKLVRVPMQLRFGQFQDLDNGFRYLCLPLQHLSSLFG